MQTILFFHESLNFNQYKYFLRNICFLFFLVCLLFARLVDGLRNHDPRESKPSKSLRDHTWPVPHQPLTWMEFLGVSSRLSQVSNLGLLEERKPQNLVALAGLDLS
jgi:hypothetical protein